MLFNSYVFIFLFLPLALAGYFVLNRLLPKWHYAAGKIWLIGMSLWFYAYFNFGYLFIIAGSIVFNYIVGLLILLWAGSGKGKAALAIGVVANLAALFVFKYYDFFISNLNAVFGTSFLLRHIVIPLGISFFTFQQIGYLLDIHKKRLSSINFWNYALFVSFFPQLIAGPIVTSAEMMPQFDRIKKKRFNADNFSRGLMAFSFGMAKKVLLADTIGQVVAWGWGSLAGLDTTNMFIVMLAYSFQIYFDFSGYCDMATGLGLMFNFKIAQNFNSPYQALDIADFWDRWHITLTRFFTKTVYIPLGGSRKGTARTLLNIMVVFLLSGFWHGASWNFVLWGAMHGLASVVYRLGKKQFDRMHPALSWLLTFGFVNLSWLYFRAPDIASARHAIKTLFSFNFGPVNPDIAEAILTPGVRRLLEWLAASGAALPAELPQILLCGLLIFMLFACLGMKNTNQRLDSMTQPRVRTGLASAALLAASILSLSGVSTFLYFNF